MVNVRFVKLKILCKKFYNLITGKQRGDVCKKLLNLFPNKPINFK